MRSPGLFIGTCFLRFGCQSGTFPWEWNLSGQRVGSIRVSSLEQNSEHQLQGVQLDRIFTDKASGKDTGRPQLAELLRFIRDGDSLMVHSMDQLASNLEGFRSLVHQLTQKGVRIEFLKEHLVFTGEDSPMAHLMLSVMGAFANFEGALMRERQGEGIPLAKVCGAYRGRGIALSCGRANELWKRAGAGEQKTALAHGFGISRETLYQYFKAES